MANRWSPIRESKTIPPKTYCFPSKHNWKRNKISTCGEVQYCAQSHKTFRGQRVCYSCAGAVAEIDGFIQTSRADHSHRARPARDWIGLAWPSGEAGKVRVYCLTVNRSRLEPTLASLVAVDIKIFSTDNAFFGFGTLVILLVEFAVFFKETNVRFE